MYDINIKIGRRLFLIIGNDIGSKEHTRLLLRTTPIRFMGPQICQQAHLGQPGLSFLSTKFIRICSIKYCQYVGLYQLPAFAWRNTVNCSTDIPSFVLLQFSASSLPKLQMGGLVSKIILLFDFLGGTVFWRKLIKCWALLGQKLEFGPL